MPRAGTKADRFLEEFAMRTGTKVVLAIAVVAGITASTLRIGTTWAECEIAMKDVALHCSGLWKPVPIGLIRHGANLDTLQDRDKLLCRWETTFVFGLPLPRSVIVRPICSRPPNKVLFKQLSRASPPG